MFTPSLHHLGQALRQGRTDRGLTQQALADRAGLTRKMVSQIEQGLPSVTMAKYEALATALGMEFALVPAQRPTFEEIRRMLRDD